MHHEHFSKIMIRMFLTALGTTSYAFSILYGLQMNKPFPDEVMKNIGEPLTRMLSYLLVYLVSQYNPQVGLALLVTIILIHIDYINLARE